MKVTRGQVLAYRWLVQGLDADPGSVPVLDTPVLDLGVQDGPGSSGALSLVVRGVDVRQARAAFAGFDEATALVWSLRGAPHLYRRAELPDVATALAPFSEKDAAKRIMAAGRTFAAAGVPVREALGRLGRAQREAVGRPAAKGTVSAAITPELDDAYLADCRPCGARHPHEMAFRLAPLHAGLEIEPGTSPPVLRRIPGWPKGRVGPAEDPGAAPAHLQVVRAYLHLLGPATAKDVATFLDAPVTDLKNAWPDDVVGVDRDGTAAWILDADAGALDAADPDLDPDRLRFLGPMDLFTAAKDRELLLPQKERGKELWPVLGRPGALACGGELLGTWRPTAAKGRLALRLTWWERPDPALLDAARAQGEVVAAARGLEFAGLA
ncbi:DNA glycosylase AlkZ-like family protein [Agilicoccus flavus]|uniref:DNA glycosylase AlkZ-like family protein n=1 Tax=Agilicoccus flavus TaxID=2775968 RepID=UPI001CF6E822|nr:crosslink repair DNA glycosylase YcaQ family protein [Agilicoccus flavus]